MLPYFQTFAPFDGNDNSVGDGLNFVGFRFKGPVSINTNWYIARADYKLTSNGNHTLYWRGSLRNDNQRRRTVFAQHSPSERWWITAKATQLAIRRCCGKTW